MGCFCKICNIFTILVKHEKHFNKLLLLLLLFKYLLYIFILKYIVLC